MGPDREFQAPWGRSLKIMSTLGTALLLGIAAVGLWRRPPGSVHPAFIIPIAAPLLILIISIPFTIIGYAVSGGKLLVHRLFWDTAFDLSTLAAADVDLEGMCGSKRIFGNGGLFSFTGLYTGKTVGRYRAYVTSLKPTVVLKLAGRTIMVSPADPGEFVRAAEEAGGRG